VPSRFRRRFPTNKLAREWLSNKLAKIPAEFRDDGMSNFPDRLFGWKLCDYARVHDWLYCTRAHAAGTMRRAHRKLADKVLRAAMAAEAPIGLRLVPRLIYRAVRMFGGASYDSCHPDVGTLCRHNLAQPLWMIEASVRELADVVVGESHRALGR
jgi:hypothetical protein